MQTVTTSKRFTINLQDVWKGIKMAVILPALTTIYTSIEAGKIDLDWKTIGTTAVLGFIGYLIKNLLAPSEIVIKNAPAETIEDIKNGDSEVVVKPT